MSSFDDDDFNFDDDDFEIENGDDFEIENGDDFDFGIDNDDDFSFEDEGDFDFDGDNGLDFDSDEDLIFDDEEESRGPSRGFIVIAGLMILLFVGALVVLVLIVLNQGPSELEIQATTIVAMNMTTEADGFATATAAAIFEQTRIAGDNMTATELARPTETPTPSPTATMEASPTANATVLAMTSQFNLTAAAETAIAEAVTDTPEGPSIDVGAVQMTATALAIALGQAPTQDAGGGPTPTLEIIGDTPVGPLPTALPDTGLFDDLAAGRAGGLGGLALMMLGLIGVIAVSRRLRVEGS